MDKKTIKFHLINDFPEDLILPPIPTKRIAPDWFKQIPPKVMHSGDKVSSVKKCMPFLDAMTAGYVLLTHVDILIKQLDDGSIRLPYLSKRHELLLNAWKPIETHPSAQVKGSPFENMTILKYMNPWIVETPKDYSAMFMPLANRLESPIIPLSGYVDTDTHHNVVNIPFLHTNLSPGNDVMIPAGTPICQIVPVKNAEWSTKVTLFDSKEVKKVKKMRNQMDKDREDYYAKNLHKKKGYN